MKKNILGVSIATMGILYGLLTVILVALAIIFKFPVFVSIIAVIVIILLQFLLGPVITDLTMKWFHKAKFDQPVPAYLQQFVDEVCGKHNMKQPKIGFIDDGTPNAFTYGHTKNDARIIITKGIFEILDEDEVKAVVAHELGHATHYDMLIMTAIQVVPLVMYALADAFLRVAGSGGKGSSGSKSSGSGSSSDGRGAVALIGLIFMLLYVITQYIILWLSRQREYYADRFAGEETGNPNALASALIQIGFGLTINGKSEGKKHSVGSPSTLGISDLESSRAAIVSVAGADGTADEENIVSSMKWDFWNPWAKWYEIHATHPLVSKRILALGKQAQDKGQEPFVVFEEKKTESYAGRFIWEFLLCLLPVIFVIAGIVLAIIAGTSGKDSMVVSCIGLFGALAFASGLLLHMIKYPQKFAPQKIRNMLGEVKVSGVTCIPCEIKGMLIGRGDPGCVFSENFVLQDETGIILLNYKQPLKTLNKIFAIFGARKYLGREVTVKGWFRRTPTPYIDMKSFEIDGQTKKMYGYVAGYAALIVFLVIFLALFVISLI